MGMKSLGHAVHGAGLSDILQSGPVSGLDEDHYWSFFDHTYIDDVSIVLITLAFSNVTRLAKHWSLVVLLCMIILFIYR